MKFKKLTKRKGLLITFVIIVIGLIIPQNFTIPVKGASKGDWNKDSFWYYPWGKSVTHKGVDIFAKEGTNVLSATHGFVVYKGELSRGGNVVLVLGPKWRLHYYAHLKTITTGWLNYTKKGELIGEVGKTGNASDTPPHLHYSIVTIIPYPWRIDSDKQGWKKIFYLNPLKFMNN
jgi:peptidoglycan LD-endopeptidase LytH